MAGAGTLTTGSRGGVPDTPLLNNQDFIRQLFHDIPDAVLVADTGRRILLANPAAERLFGYRLEELQGRRTRDLYADAEAFERQGRTRFNPSGSRTSSPDLIDYRRKSGEAFPAETVACVVRDGQGEPFAYLGIIRDVSRRQKFERVLHRLNEISSDQGKSHGEKIQAALELGSCYFDLPLGIVSRIEGETYAIEHAACGNGEISPGQSFDLGCTYCLHTLKADGPIAFHHAGKSEIAGHPCYQTFALECYIGAPLIVDGKRFGTLNYSGPRARATSFSDGDLKVVRFFSDWIGSELARLADLNRLEAAWEEAERQKRRAEEASAAKSAFLATTSHELRTPMTGLFGMLDLLESSGLNSEQSGFLEQLRACSNHLLQQLNDILDISKIEAGHLDLEEVDFDPHALVGAVAQLFSAPASAKGLVLATEVDPAVPSGLRGDPTRLQQLLSNLVGNALKFTAQGRVDVILRMIERRGREVDLQLMVSDTGEGITKAQCAAIFAPFSQADASTTRRFGGTGLGLAICKRLAEAMGGDIAVDSVPGEGATFTASLRLALANGETKTAAAPPTDAPTNSEQGRVAGLRVLAADDNAINRALLERMLRQRGYQVTVAANGREVLDRIQQGAFDVVLLDMHMPEMDGLEATRRIRRLPPPKDNLPVIALTADAVAENRVHYERIGLTAFLTKPIDWPALFAALDRHGSAHHGLRTGDAAGSGALRAAEAKPPLLDRDQLDQLAKMIGRERFCDLLAAATESLQSLSRDSRAAFSAGDHAATAARLHALKGAASNFAAGRLTALAASCEAQAQAGSLDEARLQLLVEVAAATAAELQRTAAASRAAA